MTKSHEPGVERLLTAESWACVALVPLLAAVFAFCGRDVRWKQLWVLLTLAAVSSTGVLLRICLGHHHRVPGNGKSVAEAAVLSAFAAALSGVVIARLRGVQIGLRFQGQAKDGTDDAALGDAVRARLHSLGSETPRGIELTQQTDVSTLPSDALALLPEGTLSKAATLLLGLFQSSQPWKVVVSEQATGGISVSVLRNGLVVKASVIRVRDLGLTPSTSSPAAEADKGSSSSGDSPSSSIAPDEAAQLYTAAAALVLCELSYRYAHLRPGLSGAKRWQSIASQSLATDMANGLDQDDRLELLSNAVAFDGRNVSARLALQNMRYRGRCQRA